MIVPLSNAIFALVSLRLDNFTHFDEKNFKFEKKIPTMFSLVWKFQRAYANYLALGEKKFKTALPPSVP